MFGSRIQTKGGAIKGGMPPLKYYINRLVCFIQNILLGVNFTEHFSGFRAYSRRLLETVPFQRFSNDFVFDQQMTISSISFGMRIGEIAIPTRYHDKASSIRFLKGSRGIPINIPANTQWSNRVFAGAFSGIPVSRIPVSRYPSIRYPARLSY